MKFSVLALALLPAVAQAFLVPDPSMLEDAKNIFGNAVQEAKEVVKEGLSKLNMDENMMTISQDHKSAYLRFACPQCFGQGADHDDDALFLSLKMEQNGHGRRPYLTINDQKVHRPHNHRGDYSSIVFDAKKAPAHGEEIALPSYKVSAKVKFVRPNHQPKQGHSSHREHKGPSRGPQTVIVDIWRVSHSNVKVAPLKVIFSKCPKNPQLLAVERVWQAESAGPTEVDTTEPTREQMISLKTELKKCTSLKCVLQVMVNFAKMTGKTIRLWIIRIYPSNSKFSNENSSSAQPKPPCKKPWKWPHPSYQPDDEAGEERPHHHHHYHHKQHSGMRKFMCILGKSALGAAYIAFFAAVGAMVFKVTRALRARCRGYEHLPSRIVVIRDEPLIIEDEKENLLRDEKMEVGEAYSDEVEERR